MGARKLGKWISITFVACAGAVTVASCGGSGSGSVFLDGGTGADDSSVGLHDGTVTGHVAWDMIDPNDIAAAAFFRQVTLGQTYYGYAYQPVMDTPDNIAAQIAASGPLVARLSPAGW